jgi:hypothetical protein
MNFINYVVMQIYLHLTKSEKIAVAGHVQRMENANNCKKVGGAPSDHDTHHLHHC